MSIKFIQLQACSLESFINNSSTSFDVAGFLYNDGITPVAPADIGNICFATLEPRTERMELISFTIDSVTAAGVATLTVIRGLSQKAPYGTGGASFDHESGSKMVISNNPGLLDQFARKDGDETITGLWTFNTAPSSLSPTPATSTSLGNVKLSAPAFTLLGVTTITIATPGVVTRAAHGLIAGDSVQFTTTGALPTGLIAGTDYFVIAAGLTAGAFQLSLTVGGAAINTTGAQSGVHTLYRTTPFASFISDDIQAALAGGGDFGVPRGVNKFITKEYFDLIYTDETFDADGTFIVPPKAVFALVEIWGAGGSGGASSNPVYYSNAGAGAGGEYRLVLILASMLGASVPVTIGLGGLAKTVSTNEALVGDAGGNTLFGSFASANGGNGGGANILSGPAVPNSAGGTGGTISAGTSQIQENGGYGGGSSSQNGIATAGEGRTYAGSGGGGSRMDPNTNAVGGVSINGGDGGAGSNSVATAGVSPSGGGGGSTVQGLGCTSGAGANGRIRVRTF